MIHFTAGPSQIFPTVPLHLKSALDENVMSISHRGKQFMEIYAQMESGLRAVLQVPKGYHIFVFSSATEIWERMAQNCVRQESMHLVNGNFSRSFHEIMGRMGKTAHKLEVPEGQGFDIDALSIPDSVELIAAIANESSTGVMLPAADLAKLRQLHPEKLIVVDAVSAVPTWEGKVADTDGLYFSVQKGFGLPAGLGVLILSQRMLDKGLEMEKEGLAVGSYHRFSSLLEKSLKHQTPATPNVLGIYLLAKVCQDMQRSMEAIHFAHRQKYDHISNWVAQHPRLDFAIERTAHRSHTVIVLKHDYADGKAVIEELAKQGYEIGDGYGKFAGKQFRISNFPATSMDDVKGLLAAWEQLELA